IESHITRLVSRCIEGLSSRGFEVLTPLDPTRRAGLIGLRVDDPDGLFRFLADHRIDVGYSRTYQTLRVDLHLYNNDDDVQTLLNSSHVSISYAVFCLKKKTIYSQKIR